jgi:hypothetical protein
VGGFVLIIDFPRLTLGVFVHSMEASTFDDTGIFVSFSVEFALLESDDEPDFTSKLGATEGLLVESIPGGLKPICDGGFASSFEEVELGTVAKTGPDTGNKLCFWRGTLVAFFASIRLLETRGINQTFLLN